MRTLFVAIATLGLAVSEQAYAQSSHAGHAAPAADTATVKDPANPTHEECKSVMGRKMEGRVMHDHSAEKGGARPPLRKPLSKAEMEKMHAKCAAKMSHATK